MQHLAKKFLYCRIYSICDNINVDCAIKRNKNMNIDKNKVKEIDKRIERHQKEYISKMRDAMRKAKDFEMTN